MIYKGKFLYHYSSFYQNDEGQSVYIDGILEGEHRITDQGDYMKIKPAISKEHAHHLVILNLSYLGREYE